MPIDKTSFVFYFLLAICYLSTLGFFFLAFCLPQVLVRFDPTTVFLIFIPIQLFVKSVPILCFIDNNV